MKSFGTILDENHGVGRGFDALRIILAFGVIAWHCFPLTAGSQRAVFATPLWIAGYSIVPMFFAVSGFLVTGSALRLNLKKFAASRALRIIPALFVDTMVTVLLIGPLFTTVPLADFWQSPITLKYLLNMVGEIHYYLPGVFETNPYKGVVNGSLWTIRPELACYLMMGVLIAFNLIRSRIVVAVSLAAFLVAMTAARTVLANEHAFFFEFLRSPGAKLVPMFLLGSLMYLCRYSIPVSWAAFGLGAAAMVLSGFVIGSQHIEAMWWIAITAPLLTYLIMFLGVANLPNIPPFSRGDYSYGIYLYGFPIQQAIVAITDTRNPAVLFGLTVVPVLAVAMLSWHIVEKPALKLRKGFTLARPKPAVSFQ